MTEDNDFVLETPLLGGLRYFDKEGQPLDFEEWLKLKADEEYSIIGRDEVGEVLVSTVWIGYTPRFETMVFWVSSGVNGDLPVVHYSTLAEAEAGHEVIVRQMKEAAGER